MVPKGSRQEPSPPTKQQKELVKVVAAKQASMKKYADQKRRAVSSAFTPGSWVRVKLPLRCHKLMSQLSKTLEVWSKIGSDT